MFVTHPFSIGEVINAFVSWYQEDVFIVFLEKKILLKSQFISGRMSTNTLTIAWTAWSQQPQPMTTIQVKEWQRRVKRTVPGLISSIQSHTQWDEVIKQKKEWVIASELVLYYVFESHQMAIFLEIWPWF